MEIFGGLAQCHAFKVVSQRGALTHSKHPRFLAGMVNHVSDITGGKNAVVVLNLQGVSHSQEQAVVQRQAGFLKPGWSACSGHPKNFIGLLGFARGSAQQPVANLFYRGPKVEFYATIRECLSENLTNFGVMGRKNFLGCIKQMKVQLIRIPSTFLQFVLELVLHGESEFYASCTCAYNTNG